MNTPNLQEKLLEHIQGKFSRKQDMITYLSDLLCVSTDGIYRRLRGDTLLSPQEISLLATNFKLSLDKILFDQSDGVVFSYNMLSSPVSSFLDYIGQIYKNLLEVSKIPGAQVYYASQELPIFQYFSFPRLLYFKLYVYGLTSWGFDFLKNKKFNYRMVDPQVSALASECVRLYNALPTKDVWSLNIVDNTLNQLEYLATVDRFEQPEDALLVCDEIIQTLESAKNMAVNGYKPLRKTRSSSQSGRFELYYNEMISTNNTIMVLSPMGKMLFTTINNPNFLKSGDQVFCNMIEQWFDATISHSTSISVHSAKNRDWYFNRLIKKVGAARQRIQQLK